VVAQRVAQVWRQHRRDRWRDAKSHGARVAVGDAAHRGGGRCDVIEDDLGPTEEFEPCAGQSDRARGAGQQRRTDLALQPPHQLTECRLTDMQALGGVPEVQFGGYRHECLQLTQLHAFRH
jgi:hypothetical protein